MLLSPGWMRYEIDFLLGKEKELTFQANKRPDSSAGSGQASSLEKHAPFRSITITVNSQLFVELAPANCWRSMLNGTSLGAVFDGRPSLHLRLRPHNMRSSRRACPHSSGKQLCRDYEILCLIPIDILHLSLRYVASGSPKSVECDGNSEKMC